MPTLAYNVNILNRTGCSFSALEMDLNSLPCVHKHSAGVGEGRARHANCNLNVVRFPVLYYICYSVVTPEPAVDY